MRLTKFILSLVLAPVLFILGVLVCILVCSVAVLLPIIVLIKPDLLKLNES